MILLKRKTLTKIILVIDWLIDFWLLKGENNYLQQLYVFMKIYRGHRGCDRMIVEFTTTYAISAYHN
jgi:hypothetical protein